MQSLWPGRCRRSALGTALYSAVSALDQEASAVERESVTPSAVSDSASLPLPPPAARGERFDEFNARLAFLETRVRAPESQLSESFAESRRASINSVDSADSATFVPSGHKPHSLLLLGLTYKGDHKKN